VAAAGSSVVRTLEAGLAAAVDHFGIALEAEEHPATFGILEVAVKSDQFLPVAVGELPPCLLLAVVHPCWEAAESQKQFLRLEAEVVFGVEAILHRHPWAHVEAVVVELPFRVPVVEEVEGIHHRGVAVRSERSRVSFGRPVIRSGRFPSFVSSLPVVLRARLGACHRSARWIRVPAPATFLPWHPIDLPVDRVPKSTRPFGPERDVLRLSPQDRCSDVGIRCLSSGGPLPSCVLRRRIAC